MTACFVSNISAKYYKNLSMLSRVIAKNVGDVFFETVYIYRVQAEFGPSQNSRYPQTLVKTLHSSLGYGTVPTNFWFAAACQMHQGPQVNSKHSCPHTRKLGGSSLLQPLSCPHFQPVGVAYC